MQWSDSSKKFLKLCLSFSLCNKFNEKSFDELQILFDSISRFKICVSQTQRWQKKKTTNFAYLGFVVHWVYSLDNLRWKLSYLSLNELYLYLLLAG